MKKSIKLARPGCYSGWSDSGALRCAPRFSAGGLPAGDAVSLLSWDRSCQSPGTVVGVFGRQKSANKDMEVGNGLVCGRRVFSAASPEPVAGEEPGDA